MGQGRQKKRQAETSESIQLVHWFDLQHKGLSPVFFHVPNGFEIGGTRQQKMITGARWKKQGLRAGVSDYILLKPSGKWFGFCLELKATGKTPCAVTEAQRAFLSASAAQGYWCVAAMGFEAAKLAIEDYLTGREDRVDKRIKRYFGSD